MFENKEAYKAFTYKEFRFFVLARFLVTIAVQIQSVVVGWMIYDITKDPLSLGLIGLAEAIPALSVALYAGHVVDTNDRRRIMLFSMFIMFGGALSMLVLSHWHLSGIVLCLYGIIFFSGIARGFYAPSAFTLLTQLVPRRNISQCHYLEQQQLADRCRTGACYRRSYLRLARRTSSIAYFCKHFYCRYLLYSPDKTQGNTGLYTFREYLAKHWRGY